MRLYERTDGTIAGTQAEAGKGFTQIEVPTDKAGLIAYLNRERECVIAAQSEVRAEPPVSTDTPKPPRPTPDDGADAIGDWLYNHASSGEVYDVFMCLAARFSQA